MKSGGLTALKNDCPTHRNKHKRRRKFQLIWNKICVCSTWHGKGSTLPLRSTCSIKHWVVLKVISLHSLTFTGWGWTTWETSLSWQPWLSVAKRIGRCCYSFPWNTGISTYQVPAMHCLMGMNGTCFLVCLPTPTRLSHDLAGTRG